MAKMIIDPDMCDVWGDIERESARAHRIHPTVAADALRFTAVMVEEAGEALRAALDLTRPLNHATRTHEDEQTLQFELYRETVQTAYTAIENLVAMRRRGFHRG